MISVDRLSELLAPSFPYAPIDDDPGSMLSRLFRPTIRGRPSSQIWPKLCNDVVYVPHRDGVLFRCDRQPLFLRGPSVYSLITYLSRWLTGEFCLQEIASSLDDQSRRKLEGFIRLLAEAGILRVDSRAPDTGLDPKFSARFARQLEVIDALGGDAATRFLTFRNSRVLLVGSGRSFGACATSLLRFGAQQVIVLDTDGSNEHLEPAHREAAALNAAGIEASIIRLDDRIDRTGPNSCSFDLAVYCSDCGRFDDVHFLNRVFAQEGYRFMPCLVVGQRSYMGPLIEPWCPGCWTCSIMRRTDERKAEGGPDFRAFAAANFARPEKANGAVSVALGKDVAFELMKILAGNLRHQTSQGTVMQRLRPPANIETEVISNSLSACFNFCTEFVSEPAAVAMRVRTLAHMTQS
jgi:hypothetical protein